MSQSESIEPIDRIFEYLRLIYGTEFDRIHLTLHKLLVVKALWAKRLEYWLDKPYAIDYALENLPARCLNVIEFNQLCKQAPSPERFKLPAPEPLPQRSPEQLAEIQWLIDECKKNLLKSEPWNIDRQAASVFEKIQRGEQVSYFTRQFFKEYLEKFSRQANVSDCSGVE